MCFIKLRHDSVNVIMFDLLKEYNKRVERKGFTFDSFNAIIKERI